MENEKCLDMKYLQLSKIGEIIEIVCICLGVFAIPLVVPQLLSTIFGATSFIASNSQYIVGSLVNALLILAGINTDGWKKVIGIVTLPSISALIGGLVLKASSIYTVYMIPAIWLGNFAIIYLYRYLFVKKNFNYILSSVIAIIAKCAAIYAGFNLLVLANIIPSGNKVFTVLNAAMGLNQLVTATIGAVIAFGIIMGMKHSKKVKE